MLRGGGWICSCFALMRQLVFVLAGGLYPAHAPARAREPSDMFDRAAFSMVGAGARTGGESRYRHLGIDTGEGR